MEANKTNNQEYNDKLRPWLMLAIGIILGIFISISYYDHNPNITTNIIIDNHTLPSTNGVYNNGGFYCVVTRGHTSTEIATIKEHEICHYLVDNDYDHFCGEEWK